MRSVPECTPGLFTERERTESQSNAAKLERVQDVQLRTQTRTELTATCGAAKFRPNRRFTVAGDGLPEQLFWRRVSPPR